QSRQRAAGDAGGGGAGNRRGLDHDGDRFVRGDSGGGGLQPIRRSSEPPGAAIRHLRRRVFEHSAAPRAGARAGVESMAAAPRRRKLMGEINVVPYIDVMLVLLIIFMITAPLLKEGIKVDLPNAGAKPLDPSFLNKHEPLVLTIDAHGRLYVNIGHNPDQPVSETTVSSRTTAVLHRDPQTPIL